MTQVQPDRPSSKAPDSNRSVMRHAGMASTLFAAIGGERGWVTCGTSAGHEMAWATALGALLGLAAAMVMVIRDVNR